MRFTIKGRPLPKQRPRMNRKTGRFYTPRATADYEDLVAWVVQAEGQQRLEGNLFLTVAFHMPDQRRVDLDNLLKALLDGAAKGQLFLDDKQIVRVSAAVYYGSKTPRTDFELSPLVVRVPEPQLFCSGEWVKVERSEGQAFCGGCGVEVTAWTVLDSAPTHAL